MSEGTPLQLVPDGPPANELIVDDSGSEPTYANFCRVMATPEEMIFDFGLNPQPFAAGRQDVVASQRVVMNAYTAKRLLSALAMTIERHEQVFGTIELDVNRRVIPHQPHREAVGTHGPTGQSGRFGL